MSTTLMPSSDLVITRSRLEKNQANQTAGRPNHIFGHHINAANQAVPGGSGCAMPLGKITRSKVRALSSHRSK